MTEPHVHPNGKMVSNSAREILVSDYESFNKLRNLKCWVLDTGAKPCWEENLEQTSVGVQWSGSHCDSCPAFDLERATVMGVTHLFS